MNIDQLNIDFSSKKNYDNFWLYISNKLKPLTDGISLSEWVEFIGNHLYNKYNSETNYVILEDYFKPAKIESCILNSELTVLARLINNGTSFNIELKDYGDRNDEKFQRFLIAHELAHTFLYNTKKSQFVDLGFFPIGSKEIEFLCNRIARSILMPKILLINKLNKIATPSDESFSLNEINKLCNNLKVSYSALLNRVIFDTNFWNCLFLRFRNYELEENNWKLRERYLPSIYWNNIKAFIPLEDNNKSKDNPNRYPSAKGNLKATFNSVYQELKKEKRITRKFRFEAISDRPLNSFLRYYFDQSKDVTIHFSLAKDKYSKSDYLNVCIPLPSLFKN